MKTLNVTIHITDNQSWLQVSKDWLRELNIESEISALSRMHNDQVYLQIADRRKFEFEAEQAKWHLVYNSVTWDNSPFDAYRSYVPIAVRQY